MMDAILNGLLAAGTTNPGPILQSFRTQFFCTMEPGDKIQSCNVTL